MVEKILQKVLIMLGILFMLPSVYFLVFFTLDVIEPVSLGRILSSMLMAFIGILLTIIGVFWCND